MKRIVSITCLAGLLASSCTSAGVGATEQVEEQELTVATDAAAPTADVVETTEIQLEEAFDRPLVRYYQIADT